jgi:hypothetical protein
MGDFNYDFSYIDEQIAKRTKLLAKGDPSPYVDTVGQELKAAQAARAVKKRNRLMAGGGESAGGSDVPTLPSIGAARPGTPVDVQDLTFASTANEKDSVKLFQDQAKLEATLLSLPYLEKTEYVRLKLLQRGITGGHKEEEKPKALEDDEEARRTSEESGGGRQGGGKKKKAKTGGGVPEHRRVPIPAALVMAPGKKVPPPDMGEWASKYGRFMSAMPRPPKGGCTPKYRPVSWILKTINEIYDLAYETEIKFGDHPRKGPEFVFSKLLPDDVRAVIGEDTEKPENPAVVMPFFAFEFLAKSMGLRLLVVQTCFDFLYMLELTRDSFPEVTPALALARYSLPEGRLPSTSNKH